MFKVLYQHSLHIQIVAEKTTFNGERGATQNPLPKNISVFLHVLINKVHPLLRMLLNKSINGSVEF